MMLLLSGLASASLFGPKDHDGDGIRDSADTCKHRDEVFNGFRDEDGCPDSLSAIEIAVHINGSWARNAPLTVQINDKVTTHVGRMVARDLFPDTRVRAFSSVGCLDGELNTLLGEKPRRVRLNLVPRTQEVTLLVQDLETGAPGRARVRWNELDGCGPQGPMRLSGEKTLMLGLGEHTIGLGRAGRTAYTFEVTPETEVVVIPATATNRRGPDPGNELEPIVYFRSNSAAIDPDQQEALTAIKSWLDAHPEKRLGIIGHTDERASSAYNVELAERRAIAVKQALMGLGVPEERLEVDSRGEDEPADEGFGDQALAKNRRVGFLPL